LDWTFVSPAADIHPGERTGRYLFDLAPTGWASQLQIGSRAPRGAGSHTRTPIPTRPVAPITAMLIA